MSTKPRRAGRRWRVEGSTLLEGSALKSRVIDGKVARLYLSRGNPRSSKDDYAPRLEIQLSRRSDRATFIAIQAPDGLTPTDLQRFPWATMLAVTDAARRGLRGDSTATDVSKTLRTHETGRRPSRAKDPRIAKRPGRAGHPDAHYLSVANRYKELRADGVTNPTTTIAREHSVSRDTAAGWVRGARDRGYLGKAKPGRAG
jgi:hypothetical protein